MSCRWCGGNAPEDSCPKGLTCPRCGAQPGQSCKRPSGHRASELHRQRQDAVPLELVVRDHKAQHPDQETLLP